MHMHLHIRTHIHIHVCVSIEIIRTKGNIYGMLMEKLRRRIGLKGKARASVQKRYIEYSSCSCS